MNISLYLSKQHKILQKLFGITLNYQHLISIEAINQVCYFSLIFIDPFL